MKIKPELLAFVRELAALCARHRIHLYPQSSGMLGVGPSRDVANVTPMMLAQEVLDMVRILGNDIMVLEPGDIAGQLELEG